MSNIDIVRTDFKTCNKKLDTALNMTKRYAANYINGLFDALDISKRYDDNEITLSMLSENEVALKTPIVTIHVTVSTYNSSERKLVCYFGCVSNDVGFDAIALADIKFTDDDKHSKDLHYNLNNMYKSLKEYHTTYVVLKPWNQLAHIASVLNKSVGDK